MSTKFSYDKSIAELQKILQDIQNGETGLDDLGKMIKKANELINNCRNKLRDIEAEVQELSEGKV